MAVSREIWAEIEDDIRDALPQLIWESRPGNDGFCLADHRYWVQKYATETASPAVRASPAAGPCGGLLRGTVTCPDSAGTNSRSS